MRRMGDPESGHRRDQVAGVSVEVLAALLERCWWRCTRLSTGKTRESRCVTSRGRSRSGMTASGGRPPTCHGVGRPRPFAAGLRLHPAGIELAARLGLEARTSSELRLLAVRPRRPRSAFTDLPRRDPGARAPGRDREGVSVPAIAEGVAADRPPRPGGAGPRLRVAAAVACLEGPARPHRPGSRRPIRERMISDPRTTTHCVRRRRTGGRLCVCGPEPATGRGSRGRVDIAVSLADGPAPAPQRRIFQWPGRYGLCLWRPQGSWQFTSFEDGSFVVSEDGSTIRCFPADDCTPPAPVLPGPTTRGVGGAAARIGSPGAASHRNAPGRMACMPHP